MDTAIIGEDTDFVNSAENTTDMVIKRLKEGESIKMGRNRMIKLLHRGKHTFEVNAIIQRIEKFTKYFCIIASFCFCFIFFNDRHLKLAHLFYIPFHISEALHNRHPICDENFIGL